MTKKNTYALMLLLMLLAAAPAAHGVEVDALATSIEEYPPSNHMDNSEVRGTSTEIVLKMLKQLDSTITRSDMVQAFQTILNSKKTE